MFQHLRNNRGYESETLPAREDCKGRQVQDSLTIEYIALFYNRPSFVAGVGRLRYVNDAAHIQADSLRNLARDREWEERWKMATTTTRSCRKTPPQSDGMLNLALPRGRRFCDHWRFSVLSPTTLLALPPHISCFHVCNHF